MLPTDIKHSDNYPVLGRWTLTKLLGKGATAKVYHGVDISTNEQAAVKIYSLKQKSASELLKTETRILGSLSHRNVLRLIESYDSVDFFNSSSGSNEKVTAIVMEYAQKGEFFDFVNENGYLLENSARGYFKQLLEAIAHLHAKNIAHNDIKLENLLLDKTSNLKLADFGYSSEFTPKRLETAVVGTSTYFSPELHYHLPHTAESSDLFAAGIVLFSMVTGHMPFLRAVEEDKLYASFYYKDLSEFWKYHEKLLRKKGVNFEFSESFKDLIEGMFNVNPKKRLSLTEILKHPWMSGDLIDLN